jgi:hypothetical protein
MNKTTAALDGAVAYCAGSEGQPITSLVYFHVFLVCATLVLLSMLVGAMAIAMIDTMLQMNESQDKDAKAKHLSKQYKENVESTRDGKTSWDRYRRHRITKMFILQ